MLSDKEIVYVQIRLSTGEYGLYNLSKKSKKKIAKIINKQLYIPVEAGETDFNNYKQPDPLEAMKVAAEAFKPAIRISKPQ